MNSNAIVTLADANYFELLEELINSIKAHEESKNVSICVLDAGLTNEQLELFKNDNLPTKEHLSLDTLGINPNNVSVVIKNSVKKYL